MSKKLNLYEIQISGDDSDVMEIIQVAAPDARKALATTITSNWPDASGRMTSFKLAVEDIPHVSIPEIALIWVPADGEARNLAAGLSV
jgi:hypothetical protein